MGKGKQEILRTLALYGAYTRYDIRKKVRCTYPYIHKSIKELIKETLVKKAGIKESPRGKLTKYKLTGRGLKMVFLENKETRQNWGTVEEKYPEEKIVHELRLYLSFYNEPKFREDFAFYAHGLNLDRIRWQLLNPTRWSENQIEAKYDKFVNILKEQPNLIGGFYKSLENMVNEEKETVKRGEILLKKIKPLLIKKWGKG